MMLWQIQPLLLLLTGGMALGCFGIVWTRGTRDTWLTRWLLIYFGFTLLWNGLAGWFYVTNRDIALAAAAPLPLTVIFLHLTAAFISAPLPWSWRLLPIPLALLLFLAPLVFPAAASLTLPLALFLWGVLGGRVGFSLLLAYRQTRRQPLHRNRLTYWMFVLIGFILSDTLWFIGWLNLSLLLHGLPLLALVIVGITYNLPDIRQIVRRVFSLIIVAGLLAIGYALGLRLLDELFRTTPAYDPLYGGMVLVVAAALLFQPLVRLVQRAAARLSADSDYDATALLRQYSLQVSNIVHLQTLEATAVSLISEGMGLQHGTLFLVDTIPDPDPHFEFRSVQSFGPDRLVLGALPQHSPIADYLSQIRQPLTQYNIDLLPQFRKAVPEEKEWLAALGMEVYVPVHSQGKWIGLFGLGPKISGNRYYKEDLLLLTTLADQTAVALENARLFEDLVQANQNLQQAYASLEQANVQLQEVDRLKSAFISVVSHELRTPFANIGFSLHILERYGTDHWPEGQQEELESLKQGIQRAKNMIEHLVSIASFLQKQGDLQLDQVDLLELIETTLAPLRPLADSRLITLQHTSETPLSPIQADATRLGEAIHHLVQNAIKFTPEGGQVTVRAWAEANQIRLVVQDTGVGIPPERLPGLWDSFTQMADSVTRGVESVGLGLALVKAVITAHGGDVFAQSEEGVGSEFGFWLQKE